MRILLTGATGMVGRNFTDAIDKTEHKLIKMSRVETGIEHILAKIQPDIIVHAAGLVGGIKENMARPYDFLYENAICGLVLIDAAKKIGIKKLINLGSSCMYSPSAPQPFKEEDLLYGPLEPTNEGYALAKITVAKAAQYAGYKTLMPCNLYGIYDHFLAKHPHLIANVINRTYLAKTNGGPLTQWKSNAQREFMYAGDFAELLVRAVDKYDSLPPIMNAGCRDDASIDDYYQHIINIIDYRGEIELIDTEPTGMIRKKVDITKMVAWGWEPSTTLSEGIRKTYEWYKANIA